MNVFGLVHKTGALDATELEMIEAESVKEDNGISQLLGRMAREVRRLRHELDDPWFQYAGGRVSRMAVLCRNATIERLLDEVESLKTEPKNVQG